MSAGATTTSVRAGRSQSVSPADLEVVAGAVGPAEELASQIGRSKRTIYKIRDRLILKLKKELK